MGLKIEINICDRGSVTLHHVGDLSLLDKHSRCVAGMMDELEDNARLDVNPRPLNVLERFMQGVVKHGK